MLRRTAALRHDVMMRRALPGEFGVIGDLRVAAYRADGFLSEQSSYEPTLRALWSDGAGDVLVAVDGDEIVGTVMLQSWPHGEMTLSPGEAEIRALAVAPSARGCGIGQELLTEVIRQARGQGVRHLVLLTQVGMSAAQRLYAAAGFCRLPERDWAPSEHTFLLAYGLVLAPSAAPPAL